MAKVASTGHFSALDRNDEPRRQTRIARELNASHAPAFPYLAHNYSQRSPVRAILMFLYGTGARIDETLALAKGDVDLRNHTVTFHRSTRSGRTIPIGPTLAQWLRVYSVSNSHDTENFFARKNGKAIEPRLLLRAFESVRRRMGVSRVDGMGRQPRLRDLRRTVAVHCLKAWIDQKKDLRKMLPILAAYSGHVNLASTEEYLLLAPDRTCSPKGSYASVTSDFSRIACAFLAWRCADNF